jgi:hypothetical protein
MRTTAPLPVLTALRERVQRLERGAARHRAVLPFGIERIDQHLPEGGLALGALHEVAGGGNGAIDGAAAALFTAGIAACTRGQVPQRRMGPCLAASHRGRSCQCRYWYRKARRDAAEGDLCEEGKTIAEFLLKR